MAQARKSMGKNSVRKLQYGPRTRLARGMYTLALVCVSQNYYKFEFRTRKTILRVKFHYHKFEFQILWKFYIGLVSIKKKTMATSR